MPQSPIHNGTLIMASSSPQYDPAMGQHFRDPKELMALKLISLCVGVVSMVFTLIATYHFLRMRRVFRHDLILLLLVADMIRGVCYIAFPMVSFAVHQNRRIQSGSIFCQISGFLVTVGIEAADVAVLLIALHTVLYIIRPRRHGGGSGLYPYRYWAYAAVTLLPIIDASIAFAGGMPGFEDTGSMCYLPTRERWYRMYLAWVPRYIIFSLIVIFYVGLFAFVRFAQWRYSRAHWSKRSSGTLSSATLTSSATSAVLPQKPVIQMLDLHHPGGSAAATRKNSAVSASGKAVGTPLISREGSHDGGLPNGVITGQTSTIMGVDWQEVDQRRKSVKFQPMVWGPETATKAPRDDELSNGPEMNGHSLAHAPIDGIGMRRMTWNSSGQPMPPPVTKLLTKPRPSLSAASTAGESGGGKSSKSTTTPARSRTKPPPPFSPLIEVSAEQFPESHLKRRATNPALPTFAANSTTAPGNTHEMGQMAAANTPITSALFLTKSPQEDGNCMDSQGPWTTIALPPVPSLPIATTTADDAAASRVSLGSEVGGSTLAHGSGSGMTVAKTRSRVRKQLIMLFIYPLLYIVMWMVPFLSHIIWFDSYYNPDRTAFPVQPLWVLCLGMFSLSIQGAVNASLFMWRERPWRFREEGGFWRSSLQRARDDPRSVEDGVCGGWLLGSWAACLGVKRRDKERTGGDGGTGSGKSRQDMISDGSLARTRRQQEVVNEMTLSVTSPRRITGSRNWWDVEEQGDDDRPYTAGGS